MLTLQPAVAGAQPSVSLADQDTFIPEGDLTLLENSERLVQGQFRLEATTASFDASTDDVGNVTVHITVSDKTIAASLDRDRTNVFLDGQGHAITAEERLTLQSLHAAMRDALAPTSVEASPHVDLLIRVANYWSEAPVGYEMPTKDVPRPKEQVATFSANANVANANPLGVNCDSVVRTVGFTVDMSMAACQVNDQDDIYYLPCDYADPPYTWVNSHDAQVHCFQNFWEETGPCSDGCRGRCGPGCDDSGPSTYSQDCSDHDSCCREHGGCTNPYDNHCGDEFGDADDDFFWGAEGCAGVNC